MSSGKETLNTYYENMYALDTPLIWEGIVKHGFGRGSKELGVPTANLDPDELGESANSLQTGIYYGFATLSNQPKHIYKMVMSIGWNPYYKNKKKTVEPHLLAKFDDDFYDETLRIVVLGYLRPELDFTSLEDLKTTIFRDIEVADSTLDDAKYIPFKEELDRRSTSQT